MHPLKFRSALKKSIGTNYSIAIILGIAIFPALFLGYYAFDLGKSLQPMIAGIYTSEYLVRPISNNVIRISFDDVTKFSPEDIKKTSYSITSTEDPDFSNSGTIVKIGVETYAVNFNGENDKNWTTIDTTVRHIAYIILNRPLKTGKHYVINIGQLTNAQGTIKPAWNTSFKYIDDTITGTVKADLVGYLPDSPKYAYIGNFLGDAGALLGVPESCRVVNTGNGAVVGTFPATQRVVANEMSTVKILATNPDGTKQVVSTTTPRVIGGDDLWIVDLTTYKYTDANGVVHDVLKPENERALPRPLHGEKLYSCDFSSITSSGSYYVYVPGFGKTETFSISNSVYLPLFTKSARALYFQRSGTALTSPFAEKWPRNAGHLRDAIVHPSQRDDSRFSGLHSSSDPIGQTWYTVGGWHDAGDYGKYVPTAANALYTIFAAYEAYPKQFQRDNLNIPESGNGIPDILDEAKWEVDWLKNMQAPDGGVFHKVIEGNGGYADQMPEFITQTRNIAPKTTADTATYAATMAMASRVFKPYAPAYADDLLARAEKAWLFLEKNPTNYPSIATSDGKTTNFVNPTGIGGGEYGDSEDVDNRAWAAAELYRTTGNEKYNTIFVGYRTANKIPAYDVEPTSFRNHTAKALWTYANTKHPGVNTKIVSDYKTNFKRVMDTDMIGRTDKNPYRHGGRLGTINWIGFGGFSHSMKMSWQLIQSYVLFGDVKYLQYAKVNLSPQLGSNPQYLSYITGVGGLRSPQDPTHWPSLRDGVAEPVPGIPVFGPSQGINPSYNPFVKSTKANLYPSFEQYPILRRYWDNWEIINNSEFTIEDIAMATAVYGFFAGEQPTLTPIDTTPPTTPTNTTASSISSTTSQITWSAATDPQSAISYYVVYRNGLVVGTTKNLSFTDQFANTSQSTVNYTYAVAAVNTVWLESSKSATVSIKITGDTTPPITTINPTPGSYTEEKNINLTSNEAGTTYYCFGVGCNPTTVYSGSNPPKVATTTQKTTYSITYYSKDIAGNNEAKKTAEYNYLPTVAIPGSINPGVTGHYYRYTYSAPNQAGPCGLSKSQATFIRNDFATSSFSVSWSNNGPSSDLIDNFAVCWTSKVYIQADGEYTFIPKTDDGVRVWIDGKLLVDKWQKQNFMEQPSTPVRLTVGYHDLKMEYLEISGGAVAQLLWSGPGINKTAISYKFLEATPIDTIAPVITLKDGQRLTVTQGEKWTDPGYTITDNIDSTPVVMVTGTVNTSVLGTYTITYTATDNSGNVATTARTIEITPPLDKTPPITTISPTAGSYTTTQAITLSSNETGETYYCIGSSTCSPTIKYVSTVKPMVNQSSVIRYYSRDAAGNNEAIKSTTYTIANSSTATKQGLRGEYFNYTYSTTSKSELSGAPAFTRDDFSTSSFTISWVNTGGPDPSMTDNFGVRWTGKINIPTTGAYIFTPKVDDGVRLWIDNVLIVDKWQKGNFMEYPSNPIELQSGLHTIKMEYLEVTGGAVAQLLWSSPNIPKGIVPNKYLFLP